MMFERSNDGADLRDRSALWGENHEIFGMYRSRAFPWQRQQGARLPERRSLSRIPVPEESAGRSKDDGITDPDQARRYHRPVDAEATLMTPGDRPQDAPVARQFLLCQR